MEKKKKRRIWIIVILLLIIVAAAILILRPGAKQLNINTATAQVETIQLDVMATGYVQPVDKVDVGTQVSGEISKIYVDYNSEVKQGDLLAELDKQTLSEKVTQAKASLASAQSDLDYAQQNHDRTARLYDVGAATQVALEEAINKLAQAQTSYANAKANLQQANVNYGYAEIRSPINGVILDRAVNVGQTVASSFNTPTLFTIAEDLTKMQVEADIDEADIGRIQTGQTVKFTVDAHPTDMFEGTVNQIRLQPTVTNNVVTYTVIIEAPNPDQKLLPGMTANITIITDSQKGLTIPLEATTFNPSAEISEMLNITPQGNPASQNNTQAQIAPKDKNMTMPNANAGQKEGQTKRSGNLQNPTLQINNDSSQATVWVKNGEQISQRQITTGINDGINIIVTSGLDEGQEVVLSATMEKQAKGEPTNLMPGPGRRR